MDADQYADHVRKINHAQGSPEWYTPSVYIEAARLVMGGIELDPASSDYANERFVHAERYFTKERDGRLEQWKAESVYLNPPGSLRNGESAQAKWFAYLQLAYRALDTKQAVFCMYNSSGTQTAWFQAALGMYPVCLVNHRIRFLPETGRYERGPENGSPLHGNAFIYLGPNNDRFSEIFSRFGKVIPAWLNETQNKPMASLPLPLSSESKLPDKLPERMPHSTRSLIRPT